MTFIEVLILSLALAADAFSVGSAVGLNHRTSRQVFRLSWHFGLFQALFALAGFLAGSVILEYIHTWDHWLAFGLLVLIGINMIVESVRGDNHRPALDLTRGFSLVSLSTAVSIDAMAAGIGLATVEPSPRYAILLIGLTAGAATVLAMRIGNRVGDRFGRWAGGIAGVVLMLLGVRILITG